MFSPVRIDAHNPGPMTGSGNHTYLLTADRGGATLVDAGVADPRHLQQLAEVLRRTGAGLDRVLVTHAHADHAAGVSAIARVHPRARFFKYPWPEEDPRYPVAWHPLEDGDQIDAGGETLVALHTPGHSPDHLAFWHAASRTVFTGDLVNAGASVTIPASGGGDLRQYLASLERLLALEPVRLLPAHGPKVHDAQALLRGHVAHRIMRERQVIGALVEGRATVPSIAESIYDGLAPALMPAAVENVRAHLEKLRQEGRAVDADGRWRVSPT